MADIFGADTGTLNTLGNRVVDNAQQFIDTTNNVYQTIDDLINKGYISDTSREIAESIKAKQVVLKNIATTIQGHGDYLINTSRKVSNTESDISTETKKYQN